MDTEEIDRNARQRLKLARIDSGKHPDQLSRYTGHSSPWYYDVENCDGELCYTLDLQDVKGLCAELGTTVRKIFASDSQRPLLTPEKIVESIRKHLSKNPISLDSFEDEVNYTLSAALNDPQTIWKDWNIECLRNVCDAVGLNWVELFD